MSDEIMTAAEALEDDAIPRARVALAEGAKEATAEGAPLPPGMTRRPQKQKTPAEWAYERVILYIQKFEEQLDAEHEVGMGFTGGDAGTIHIMGVGFFEPDIITFYGVDEAGAKTQMIQHVSQLNVMLKAAPKQKATATRIGFKLAQELERDEA